MAKSKKAFENIKTTNDLIKIFEENIDLIMYGYFNEKLLETALLSLNNFDNEKLKHLYKLIQVTDSKINQAGQARYGLRHKIPTILASIIYIEYFFEEIKKYQPEEMLVLARFTASNNLEEYEESIKIYPQEILKEVIKKNKSIISCDNVMIAVQMLREKEKTTNEIIEYLQSKSYDEIRNDAEEYEREIIKYMEEFEYEGRRF